MVPMRYTPVFDWRPMLTMNLWYLCSSNYELVASLDVAPVITPTTVGSVGAVRPEGGLKGFGRAFTKVIIRPLCNLIHRYDIFPFVTGFSRKL